MHRCQYAVGASTKYGRGYACCFVLGLFRGPHRQSRLTTQHGALWLTLGHDGHAGCAWFGGSVDVFCLYVGLERLFWFADGDLGVVGCRLML